MAYDSLNNQQLIDETLAKANQLENMTQAVMRRLVELQTRGCSCDHGDDHTHDPVEPEPVEPDPVEPIPDPPPHDDDHTHEPTPATDVLASEIPLIESNFDKSPWIRTVPQHQDRDAAPDVVGAFRMTANISHLNYDDSIVFPHVPGAAHLHMYWGNTISNAHSTYESYRKTGNGTMEGGPLNRSSYWMPALLLGDKVALPTYITVYYKRLPDLLNTAHVPLGVKDLVELPRGLRMITKGGEFVFFKADGSVKKIKSENYAAMPAELANLRPGDSFQANVTFPTAWNGEHVDSVDHMSHVAHPVRDPRGSGKLMVPETHPYLFVTISQHLMYEVLEGDDWTRAEYSSDRAMAAPPFSTVHADYYEAWDDATRAEWHENALERMLNCSGGDMGSGRSLIRPPSFSFNQQPARIPLTDIPAGGEYRLID